MICSSWGDHLLPAIRNSSFLRDVRPGFYTLAQSDFSDGIILDRLHYAAFANPF